MVHKIAKHEKQLSARIEVSKQLTQQVADLARENQNSTKEATHKAVDSISKTVEDVNSSTNDKESTTVKQPFNDWMK